MIDLYHLRIFVRICELNSFTQAAVAVGVAQPTVSRIVKDLEQAWGAQLFYRTGRGVTLSEFGEVALARAQALLNEADQLGDDLRAHSGVPTGTVSLGVSPSLAPILVPELVNLLRQDAPGIRLRIREGFSDQIERWRSAGAVDVGVTSNFRELGPDSPEADNAVLFASNLVLVAPPDAAPLPPRIPFSDLAGYPLALPALPNGLRTIFEDVARRKGLALDVTIETSSLVVQKQLCEHCGCYLVKAPETIAEEFPPDSRRTGVIIDPTIQRYLQLATTTQRPLSRAAREVARRMTEILKRLSSGATSTPSM